MGILLTWKGEYLVVKRNVWLLFFPVCGWVCVCFFGTFMYSGTVQPWPVAGYGTGPSCGEQEAPHRPCASVPAGRKEILHLLLCKSPPSSKARVLLLSLANSGCVPYCWDGTCRCCRGLSQWLYIIDVSHRRVPFFSPLRHRFEKNVKVEPKMWSMGARTLLESHCRLGGENSMAPRILSHLYLGVDIFQVCSSLLRLFV